MIDNTGDPAKLLDSNSLVIAMCDNIGFKCIRTYEQFVLYAFMAVPKEKLRELGILAASNIPRDILKELPNGRSYLAGERESKIFAERVAERLKSVIGIVNELP